MATVALGEFLKVKSFPLAGAWTIHLWARPVEYIKPKVETTNPERAT
jgi:hypothetical protein